MNIGINFDSENGEDDFREAKEGLRERDEVDFFVGSKEGLETGGEHVLNEEIDAENDGERSDIVEAKTGVES